MWAVDALVGVVVCLAEALEMLVVVAVCALLPRTVVTALVDVDGGVPVELTFLCALAGVVADLSRLTRLNLLSVTCCGLFGF